MQKVLGKHEEHTRGQAMLGRGCHMVSSPGLLRAHLQTDKIVLIEPQSGLMGAADGVVPLNWPVILAKDSIDIDAVVQASVASTKRMATENGVQLAPT
jgi:hypothetical protein